MSVEVSTKRRTVSAPSVMKPLFASPHPRPTRISSPTSLASKKVVSITPLPREGSGLPELLEAASNSYIVEYVAAGAGLDRPQHAKMEQHAVMRLAPGRWAVGGIL